MGLGPLPPVANWFRVVTEGEVDNLDVWPFANVLHFQYSGAAPSNATCAGFASSISSAWSSHIASLCPSPTHLTKVTVTDLTSDTAGAGEWTGDIPGTRGDDSIPANAAVLISYPAPVRYRGGHPRQYLYVLGNADLNGAAQWASTSLASVLTGWKAFLAAIEALSASGTAFGSFGTIKYYGKFAPNSGPPRYRLTTPVPMILDATLSVAAAEIASQRRRVGRRKR